MSSPSLTSHDDATQKPRRGNSDNPFVTLLASLASLKLTVFLFSLSLVLVLCGTLAQDKLGIWDVVKEYFRSFFVWIPFNVFLPRQWFGDSWQDVRMGFWFFGGKSIGIALFINLLAAHAVRFKIQTRGLRLGLGVIVIAMGAGLAFMMIANGNLKDGIQDLPTFSWQTLWGAMVAGTGVMWLVMLGALFRLPANQFLERILLLIGFVLMTGVLGWMGYWTSTGKRLDDASLRILWQLIQGTIAGGVLLAGCVLAFKNRAGMVLLHAGIGLMMLNELLVAQYAVEEQMSVAEGEVVAFARDTRAVEIAIIDRSNTEEDLVTVIPGDWLEPGKIVDDELLPFKVRVEQYLRNSSLEEKTDRSLVAAVTNYDKEPIEVTGGLGEFYNVNFERPVAGADASNQVDMAAAYISLIDKEEKNGKPFATILLSQAAYLADVEEEIEHEGTTYFLGLRYKRNYKPYKIALEDVSRETYVGTEMPKGFASTFEIIDSESGNRLPATISMNNPLRYGGETFYQSGYRQDQASGREVTTIQIVTNDGWMIPYVGCMLVVVGMLAHFGLSLVRFLRRRDVDAPMLFGGTVAFLAGGSSGLRLWREAMERGRRAKQFEQEQGERLKSFEKQGTQNQDDSSIVEAERASDWIDTQAVRQQTRGRVAVGIVVGIGVLLTGYYLLRNPAGRHEPALDDLGRIPVVSDGRVLPFDSLARNTLRLIKRREEFTDLSDKRQPAVKWMMDVMVGAEAADEYEVFSVKNHELQTLLKLPLRKSKNYSLNEINDRREAFEERFQEARETPTEKRDNYQKAVLDLKRKLNTYEALERVYELPPPPDAEVTTDSLLKRIDLSMFLMDNIEDVPLGVTTHQAEDSGELGWETYQVAATRQWLVEQAKSRGIDRAEDLAEVLFKKIVPDAESFIEQRVDMQLVQNIEMFLQSQSQGQMTEGELQEQAMRLAAAAKNAPEMQAQIKGQLEPAARQELIEVRSRFFDSITRLLPGDSIESADNPAVDNWTTILRAYKAGDGEVFDSAVESQLAYAQSVEARDLDSWKVSFESFYRRFSPLYVASILYVFAGVVTALGWAFWTRDMNRAAFWLLVLAFAIHSFALLSRMAISGRPPVTNLYSSAVFIGWAAVLIGLMMEWNFRIGVGNLLASVFGFNTLMIAYALSIEEDTFKVVVAVLDTQFWLATHVVCITLGYATTFIAGGLGVTYIVAGILSNAFDRETRKTIARMLYGMVCFSIFFSFFGTVLGGLWADDSWGRFWGWDPKENGALLIVIWNALILHARWGGMVRERGMAMLAVGGNIVTTWSWFLVNQLGIGLHSYGFTEGVLLTAGAFCATQLIVIGVGFLPTRFWGSYRHDPPRRRIA